MIRIADSKVPDNMRIGSPDFCRALTEHSMVLSAHIAQEWNFPGAVVHAIEEQRHSTVRDGMSATGAILKKGDSLSKAQPLYEHGAPGIQGQAWLSQLAESERKCMQEMQSFAAGDH